VQAKFTLTTYNAKPGARAENKQISGGN